MNRNRYLVSYDIADDRRRAQVHQCMSGFGEWMQFSVFVCDLSDRELIQLRTRVREIIHYVEDSIMIADLGPAMDRGRYCFEFMGRPLQLPSPRGPTIV